MADKEQIRTTTNNPNKQRRVDNVKVYIRVLRSDERTNYAPEYFPGEQQESDGCCQGLEGVQLWGHDVNGNPLRFDSANDCCKACIATCHNNGHSGPCLCDSWSFCGDKESCTDSYGKCWLKKQKYMLDPVWKETEGEIWTSGFVFGNVEASFGPPYGLIQGTLEAEGVAFKKLSSEEYSVIRRGSVAWVGSGPEFFVSLVDHPEWKKTYMVIGHVVPEDMKVFERLARLPTIPNIWNHISVLILEKPVSFRLQRDTK
ncbi:uncharacterized protein LOC143576674 [Bidens hawaiensis]|uniref:uncharacterized protein LOC143576674 n=1 Tax=Bidens hawaiensis TaxID=980011 RepID=UPI00404B75C8